MGEDRSVHWRIHRAIPGSERAVFERSGHLPRVEEEDAFVARRTAILAAAPAPQRGVATPQ